MIFPFWDPIGISKLKKLGGGGRIHSQVHHLACRWAWGLSQEAKPDWKRLREAF